MEKNANFITLGGRPKRERSGQDSREPIRPKPTTPEEKEARNRQRKANALQKRLAKKERRAAADKPIAGKDGEFDISNDCTLCLQKGHLKKQCPLPRKEARTRQRDLLTDDYRKRMERVKRHAAQQATTAGKDAPIEDNAEVRHQRKLKKRAARQAAKAAAAEAGAE